VKRLLQVEAGETIIKEGDVGESAYLIEDGEVEVSRAKDDQKVVLATLGKGEIFGEMSMIDDCPRGATITATTATTLSELHRDEFLDNLKDEPEFAIRFLRTIFERLRDANIKVLQLEQADAKAGVTPAAPSSPAAPPADRKLVVTLAGETPEARESLPENPYRVEYLPLLIGRKSDDPLVNNHWNIDDDRPWQISRHHLKLVREAGRVCAVDRGSTLGSLVDGEMMGGRQGPPGPIEFKEPEGFLVLGNDSSPYRYKVTIEEV